MGWERLRVKVPWVGKGESEPRMCTWGRNRWVPNCLNAVGLMCLEERSLVGSCPALSHLALINIFPGNLGIQVGLSLWTVVMGEERDKVEIPEILDLRSKTSGWKEPQPEKQHSPTSTATG